MRDLRSCVLDLFQVGIDAADPAAAVRRALKANPPAAHPHLIAVGKAACAMMRAALEFVTPRSALAVTSYENAQPVAGAQVLGAGHPRPDAAGLAAAQQVKDLAQRAGADAQIVLLLSGGGSALLPCPLPGLTLDDKQATNDLMLAAGMPIEAINLVRQNLSQLKGGGLRALAAPARVRTLILSDVIGDDLRAVASGPTTPPLGTAQDAVAALHKAQIWPRLPRAVQDALTAATPRLPKNRTELPPADNALIGSNAQSLRAMAAAGQAKIMNAALTGDVEAAAAQIAQDIRNTPAPTLLWGGETTVTVRGTGKGGRNQELALHVLTHLEDLPGPWAFLSGGTDGIDGPTNAAGGLVDHTMTLTAHTRAQLANNDAYPALQALGGLIVRGATGTNVADLQISVRG